MDSESAFREVIEILHEFQGAVSSRFDRVDATLAEHDKRFEGVEFHLGSLDRRVGHIETRLENVETRLENVETRVVNVETRVVNVETHVVQIGTTVEQLQRRLPAY
jgi:chromosome segregation ATPase